MKKFLVKIFLFILIFGTLGYGKTYGNSISSLDTQNLNIYSNYAIMIDLKTGNVLYEKNSRERLYPASTTKILTAILVLEKCYLNELVTVSSSALSAVPSSYTTAGLHIGEQLRVEDLLYLMLIPSANDAANVLAEHVSGSIPAFAELMNQKAKEIGATNSHFTNPSRCT